MKIRRNCRICSGNLKKIIKFNRISLVGEFLKNRKKQKKYPISLNYCKTCMHLQIAEIINPKKLFSNYLWETSVSSSNFKIFSDLVDSYKGQIKRKTKIFEVASNDGSFLIFLKKKFNCFTLGIDPAVNLKNKNKKIDQISGFFNYKSSKKIFSKYGYFDFIFARNVLAHVTNPNEIFLGIRKLLKENGKAIIEVPHLLPIIKKIQYDNIFHEHQGFHSVKSINDLCIRNNLCLTDVKNIESQGGSIRCEIRKKSFFKLIKKEVNRQINIEKKEKLFNRKFLEEYKNKILHHKKKLNNLIKNLKLKEKKISIYGASGKGQALLQYCNINEKMIDKVYDKSKLKNKRYTPGSGILIENPIKIRKEKIDFLLLMAWNIKDEIIKQEMKFIKKGGRFILPFPQPKIIKK